MLLVQRPSLNRKATGRVGETVLVQVVSAALLQALKYGETERERSLHWGKGRRQTKILRTGPSGQKVPRTGQSGSSGRDVDFELILPRR